MPIDQFDRAQDDRTVAPRASEVAALQAEIQRIAASLDRLARDERQAPPSPFIDDHLFVQARHDHAGPGSDYDRPTVTAAQVRAILRQRRARDELFDSGLFADPAWDMLLDLYAATLDRRSVTISSLCIAASVPSTTALRWIKSMTEDGLFVRTPDRHDARRVYIALTAKSMAAMNRYFARAPRVPEFV